MYNYLKPMRAFFYILFSISTVSFGLEISQNVAQIQNQAELVSETRQLYLDKSGPIEKRIAEIDGKWNWIIATPSEDSIAKAQGWYEYMGAQRDQLKADLVTAKIEQLENYYQDIIDLFGSQIETLNIQIAAMKDNRLLLAPNYPAIDEYKTSTHLNSESLTYWIINAPQEYQDFTVYLEKLIINNY